MMQQTSIKHPSDQSSEQSVPTTKRNVTQFIWIRVIACLFIVLLHTLFSSTVYFSDTITSGQLTATQTVQHLLMWAVPCFLMVTGALLLDPERQVSMKKLFGRYIRRIALALICFTLLFQILDYCMGDETSILPGWLSNLFQGHSWAHMWYLYLMLGIYLMIPFYKMVADQAKLGLIWFLNLIIVVFVSILPMGGYLGLEDCGFYIPTSLIYPVYVFGGYALYQKNQPVWLASLVLAVSTIMIITLSLLGAGDDFFGYDSILVVAQSLALFSLLLRLKLPAGEVIRTLDDCSFGIYLIHMIGIRFVMKWVGFDPFAHGAVLCFALMVIAFFVISFAATYLLRLIPKLNLL